MIIKDNMANMCAKVTSTYMEFTLAFGPKLEFSFSFKLVGIVLTEKELFTEYAERMFANVFIIIIIVWFGNIAGKIPFNRYIGLRLPWLLADEETWNIGHRLLEYCSLPLAIIYLGLIPFVNNKNLAICIVALWIIIPGVISYLFYKRKFKNY